MRNKNIVQPAMRKAMVESRQFSVFVVATRSNAAVHGCVRKYWRAMAEPVAADASTSTCTVNDIVGKIQSSLECPICLEMMTEPYRTPCNHLYCKECIHTAISSAKKPKCPLCKERISRRSIHPNIKIGGIIKAVQELADAVAKDTGHVDTPPVVPHSSKEASGTPGILLHSLLYPTPCKPSRTSNVGPSNFHDPS